MGHTALGKDLSPKIASKLETGLISDVTHVDVSGGNLVLLDQFIPEKHLKRKLLQMGYYLPQSVLII